MKPDDACDECWEMADEYTPGATRREDEGPKLCASCWEERDREASEAYAIRPDSVGGG